MVNEIVVAKKLRRIAVIFCIMHLHNEYYFVVDVVVTIAIFMQPWEVPIFDQPC
jgi:orotate phosphoribosyltransferase-like protein